ncbi:hypothetical protein [Streptomyces sp. AN091965]|uniref:hypothetical protein n=1 Tax=Streptomyces sp. AN091965 TaxID=2927803 RepID=UPI001F60CBF0|nr:hypothetical protein [Streptomyces sp. AN091965]MCI3931874.1 hypothetical protein [Streptomyces sp. AN091965]
MTSWLCRAARAVVPVALVSVLLAPAPGYAADPSPAPSAAYYDEVALAGSRAGEGRTRPGRAEPLVVPDPRGWRPLPPPAARKPRTEPRPPPAADVAEPSSARRTATGPPIPGLRVLPLGAGLVLIGLGLGFLGLRVRRG